MRLGLLPIADTILLEAAVRENYFAEQGLLVELVPFQSTLEKDAAVQAGLLDGHFCEISSPMVLRSQGYLYKVIASTTHTEPGQRVFGIVTRPGSGARSLNDLKGQTLGIARQTIVDFLADIFLDRAGQPADFFRRQDIRKIPLRLQMLRTGRLEASVFPEPLLSMAESSGGRVLAVDCDLDMPLAAVALKDGLASDETVRAFRAALSRAAAWVSSHPEASRALMLEKGLIGPSLSGWTPPAYNPEHIPGSLPDRKLFEAYADWLVRNKVLKRPGDPGHLREVPGYEETIFHYSGRVSP
jgi:NitT/TauT family transport system substrate-binding protein